MEQITLFVGPEQADCVGVGPQKCLLVRRSPQDDYTYFYDRIHGFEFEPGYEYELLVDVTEVENPPADASSLRYSLVEIVSKEPAEKAEPEPAVELEGTRWLLNSLVNDDGELVAALPGVEATAVFEDGRVGGKSGCNRYGADYTLDGDRLTVSPQMMSTMMACPEPVMTQERQFQSALVAATGYTIDGASLTLTDAAGEIVATLEADKPAPLTGTTWVARNYNNGKQAVVSILAGTSLTALFSDDGGLSGSSGCNNYRAEYTLSNGRIAISPAASTRKMCVRPEGIMEQEAQYLAALATAATWRIDGKVLELRTDSGALVASYKAE